MLEKKLLYTQPNFNSVSKSYDKKISALVNNFNNTTAAANGGYIPNYSYNNNKTSLNGASNNTNA